MVNHARSQDVTEGYAADWTMEQLRDAAQHIADRIDDTIREGRPTSLGPDEWRAGTNCDRFEP